MEQNHVDDAQRSAALQRLRDEWQSGALNPTEHERRATLVRRARDHDELEAAIEGRDHTGAVSPVPPIGAPERSGPPERTGGLVALDPKIAGTIMGLTPLVALVLFFATSDLIDNSWLWFLAIPAVAILVYGPSGRSDE